MTDTQPARPPEGLPRATIAEPDTSALAPLSVFDVCHVGVVLRAVLSVQSILALLLALEANSLSHWGLRFLDACAVSVPALLAWLLIVCGLRRRLVAWSPARVRTVLLSLGAVCAFVPWALGVGLLSVTAFPAEAGSLHPLRVVAVVGAGALAAAVLLSWLGLRARAQGPSGLQARWVELQSRIRPHFLFNTLNTAVALVRIDPQQAERVLEDLAELFRAALAAPDWTSTLADEVDLAHRYLEIEQLRFGARLRLRWDLDPACSTARVPPLLLQPLVENAVRYGVEPNEDGGDVLVRTRRRSGQVELLVRNSLAAAAPGGHGIALDNVRERLRLLHDVAADLSLEPEPHRFSVRLLLPL
jgi:two-component system, LytTR family, sensor histidine kinase AlgZ